MTLAEMMIELGLDAKGLEKGMKSASRSVMDGMRQIGNALGVAVGFGAFVAVLKDSVAAAAESERASMKLTTALRAQGITSTQIRDDIIGYSSALQRATAFDDEAITGAQTLLVQLGRLSGDGLQRATKATLDLAAGLDVDLQTAARLVGKAAMGNVQTFQRYGLAVEKTGDVAKDFDGVLAKISERFGGAASAELETYSGQVKQLGNAWGDVKEKIGAELIPVLTTAATKWSEILFAMSEQHKEGANRAANDAERLEGLYMRMALAVDHNTKAYKFLTDEELEFLKGNGAAVDSNARMADVWDVLKPKVLSAIELNKRTAEEYEEQAEATDRAQGAAADKARQDDINKESAKERAKAEKELRDAIRDQAIAQVELLEDQHAAQVDFTQATLEAIDEIAYEEEELAQKRKDYAEQRAQQLRQEAQGNYAVQQATSAVGSAVVAVAFEHQTAQQAMEAGWKNLASSLVQHYVTEGLELAVGAVYEKMVAATSAEAVETTAAVAGSETRKSVREAETAAAVGGSATIAGSAVAGESTSTGATLAGAGPRITAHAATAAAGAAESQSSIPIVGPALALAAMAAIFAAVVGMKGKVPGFAKGGDVVGPPGKDRVLARLTAGEHVLTEDEWEGRSASGVHVHFHESPFVPRSRADLERQTDKQLVDVITTLAVAGRLPFVMRST